MPDYVDIITTNGTRHSFETARGTCTTCKKSSIDHPVTIDGEPATIIAVFPDDLRVRYPGIHDMDTVPHEDIDQPLCHDGVGRHCSCQAGQIDDTTQP